MLGIIRVLTMRDRDAVELHGRIVSQACGMEVRSACIDDQPQGIFDDETMDRAVPKVVELAERLEQDGCTQIGISCFGDPALAESRAAVSIPVLGAGSAAAHMARALSDRIGVLTIVDSLPPHIMDILGDCVVGVDKPDGIATSPQLTTDKGKAAAIDGVRRLKARGADTILLGCTGFATMGFAAEIGDRLGVRLVDPLLALAACATISASGRAQPGPRPMLAGDRPTL
ncbi:MAG: aspartate/glutamate racemase family protein [Rhizobiaceae bacterium]